MSRDDFAALVRSVRCPRCNAAPGEVCYVSEKLGPCMHFVRWIAAESMEHDPGDEDRSVVP